MPHTNSWNNATPAGSEFASAIDNHMRTMKLDVAERMAICFIWNSSVDYDGYPKALPFRASDNTSLLSISAANSLTGSNAQNMIDLAQTWNTTGAPTALKVNITNTASDAASKLFDFQIGGSSRASLTAAGLLTALTGSFGATSFTGTVTSRVIQPDGDNTRALGAVGARWSTAYIVDVQGATATWSGAVVFNGAVTFNSSVSSGIITTDLTLTGNLAVAGSVDFAGAVVAGSGNVTIIDSTGKIPAISSTYFASLSGTNLTGVAFTGSANTFSGVNNFVGYSEEDTAISISAATLNIDMSLGSSFTFTLDATITTMNITNIPASGKFASFVLRMLANGSGQTWNWFSSTVKWPSASTPTRTTTSGRLDVYYFHTVDGGSTWFGSVVGQNWTP